ncbi:hypothetical protein [Mycolicibacterium fortuitum]|uniref:hypothetical protein n=1 Tax=Mycolicibacterium fortuitum TaxID=1766 RepID=UPI00260612BF|nr:hypothetical protein [Mycolicibacterium fortuitum]
MPATTFRKQPVEVQALQWDGTEDRADELYDWTAGRYPSAGGGTMLSTRFMVLGEDDAYETFRCYDEDLEIIPGNIVDQLIADGYTATIYVQKSGQWAHLRTGDWVIAETDGDGHYPCAGDVFASTYESAPDPDRLQSDIYFELSDDDRQSFETRTSLLTIRHRISAEIAADPDDLRATLREIGRRIIHANTPKEN